MWANTHPHGGVIFVGVEDKGQISGCKRLSTEEINKLELVKTYCSDGKYAYKKVAVKNESGEDDFVMVFRVYFRDDKLVETNDGTAWIRVGSQKHRLSEDEKREIRIARGQVEYELETVNLNWPDDFDIGLADQLVNSFRTKRMLTQPRTREQILSLLHLAA
jgi:ATP-dependent DNA helicase RecG